MSQKNYDKPIEQIIEEGSKSNDEVWAGVAAHIALIATTKPIEEAVQFTDMDAIIEEIYQRKKLRNQMVGDLYPNIVADEIGRLVKRYGELQRRPLADALYERSRRES